MNLPDYTSNRLTLQFFSRFNLRFSRLKLWDKLIICFTIVNSYQLITFSFKISQVLDFQNLLVRSRKKNATDFHCKYYFGWNNMIWPLAQNLHLQCHFCWKIRVNYCWGAFHFNQFTIHACVLWCMKYFELSNCMSKVAVFSFVTMTIHIEILAQSSLGMIDQVVEIFFWLVLFIFIRDK